MRRPQGEPKKFVSRRAADETIEVYLTDEEIEDILTGIPLNYSSPDPQKIMVQKAHREEVYAQLIKEKVMLKHKTAYIRAFKAELSKIHYSALVEENLFVRRWIIENDSSTLTQINLDSKKDKGLKQEVPVCKMFDPILNGLRSPNPKMTLYFKGTLTSKDIYSFAYCIKSTQGSDLISKTLEIDDPTRVKWWSSFDSSIHQSTFYRVYFNSLVMYKAQITPQMVEEMLSLKINPTPSKNVKNIATISCAPLSSSKNGKILVDFYLYKDAIVTQEHIHNSINATLFRGIQGITDAVIKKVLLSSLFGPVINGNDKNISPVLTDRLKAGESMRSLDSDKMEKHGITIEEIERRLSLSTLRRENVKGRDYLVFKSSETENFEDKRNKEEGSAEEIYIKYEESINTENPFVKYYIETEGVKLQEMALIRHIDLKASFTNAVGPRTSETYQYFGIEAVAYTMIQMYDSIMTNIRDAHSVRGIPDLLYPLTFLGFQTKIGYIGKKLYTPEAFASLGVAGLGSNTFKTAAGPGARENLDSTSLAIIFGQNAINNPFVKVASKNKNLENKVLVGASEVNTTEEVTFTVFRPVIPFSLSFKIPLFIQDIIYHGRSFDPLPIEPITITNYAPLKKIKYTGVAKLMSPSSITLFPKIKDMVGMNENLTLVLKLKVLETKEYHHKRTNRRYVVDTTFTF